MWWDDVQAPQHPRPAFGVYETRGGHAVCTVKHVPSLRYRAAVGENISKSKRQVEAEAGGRDPGARPEHRECSGEGSEGPLSVLAARAESGLHVRGHGWRPLRASCRLILRRPMMAGNEFGERAATPLEARR